ncbi:GntR family transcriptional regulator [uncultured Tateyamaria sp.]|uniref:GntR family transcriptional regulator n=1 Tax=uncultured Tateyamaria sp. TaxID=455651 RepID=UPI0026120C8B|nr:GntR family transcriptional regulator [uncultured Tateyamaria sp.]
MIQRVVLSEQVKEELLDDILSGRYKPGDRLVESQIAKRMGISQSPVREALRDMVAMRFVEVVPHKGARVRRVEEREILEIYPVRASLEELAGRLAAENAKPHLGELERAVERMTKAFKMKDARKMAHWDVQFHRTIMEATGNQILIETWGSLMIEARTYVTLSNLMARVPDLDLADWHDPIIEALREGNPERCGAEMRNHVEAFGEVMKNIFDSKQGTTDPDRQTASVDYPAAPTARTG